MNAAQRRKVRRLGARIARAQARVRFTRHGETQEGQAVGFWARELQVRVKVPSRGLAHGFYTIALPVDRLAVIRAEIGPFARL